MLCVRNPTKCMEEQFNRRCQCCCIHLRSVYSFEIITLLWCCGRSLLRPTEGYEPPLWPRRQSPARHPERVQTSSSPVCLVATSRSLSRLRTRRPTKEVKRSESLTGMQGSCDDYFITNNVSSVSYSVFLEVLLPELMSLPTWPVSSYTLLPFIPHPSFFSSLSNPY